MVAIDYQGHSGHDWANCVFPEFSISDGGYQKAEECYFQLIQKWQRIFLYEWESPEWEYIKYHRDDLTNIYISLYILNHRSLEERLKVDKIFSAGDEKKYYSFLEREKYLVDGYGRLPNHEGKDDWLCSVGGITMPKWSWLMPGLKRVLSLEKIKITDIFRVGSLQRVKKGDVIYFVKTDKPIVVTHERKGLSFYYLACNWNGIRSWLSMGILTRRDAFGNPVDGFRAMVLRESNINSLYRNLLAGKTITCIEEKEVQVSVYKDGYPTSETKPTMVPVFELC